MIWLPRERQRGGAPRAGCVLVSRLYSTRLVQLLASRVSRDSSMQNRAEVGVGTLARTRFFAKVVFLFSRSRARIFILAYMCVYSVIRIIVGCPCRQRQLELSLFSILANLN